MITQAQENPLLLKQDNENNKSEEVENNNETANDIRDDKDNRKKDMENHISEHDIVLDMGSGNEALTLFNETSQHSLSTEFFIIDETKEFTFPSNLQTHLEPSKETFISVELFDVLSHNNDSVNFEFLEVFNQEKNSTEPNNVESLGLILKSYHASDYASQETIVYKQEEDAIYKEDLQISIEL